MTKNIVPFSQALARDAFFNLTPFSAHNEDFLRQEQTVIREVFISFLRQYDSLSCLTTPETMNYDCVFDHACLDEALDLSLKLMAGSPLFITRDDVQQASQKASNLVTLIRDKGVLQTIENLYLSNLLEKAKKHSVQKVLACEGESHLETIEDHLAFKFLRLSALSYPQSAQQIESDAFKDSHMIMTLVEPAKRKKLSAFLDQTTLMRHRRSALWCCTEIAKGLIDGTHDQKLFDYEHELVLHAAKSDITLGRHIDAQLQLSPEKNLGIAGKKHFFMAPYQ